MMTTQEVAEYLSLSTNTVRRWSDRGVLSAYRIGSRRDRRFLKRDVETLLAKLREEQGNELRP